MGKKKSLLNQAFRATPIQLSEIQDGTGISERVQLLKTGTFYHDKYGKLEITEATLAELKANFDGKVRGIDIAIDFSHKSEDEAAGWVKSVEIEFDEQTQQHTLWADVEWTDTAIKKLSEKQFRYISSNFNFEYRDNETLKNHGAVLLGAGLTNRPVVKGMAPIVELAEYDPLRVNIDDVNQNKNPEGEKMEELEALKKENAELKAKIEAMMGEKKAGEEKVEAMEKELAETKEKIATAEKKAEFDVMLSEGKVVESQRDAFMKDDMKAFIAGQKELNLSEKGHGKEGQEAAGDKNEKTAQDEVMELAEAKIKEGKTKDLGDAISMVLSENKELAGKYSKEVEL